MDFPDIKIQLMSGFDGDKNSSHFNESLQKRLIHKPFSAKDLVKNIADLMADSSAKS